MKDVRLVGLDFGTTTSRCVAATARLSRNAVTGRHELSDIREVFRSPIVLTPFCESGLDVRRLERDLDTWLTAARTGADEIFGGGALVTGLAAQQANSRVLVEMIRSRVKDVLVATAGDPCLEAWLAFQANAGPVSRSHPGRWAINLDIGGGTTNIALGKAGEVTRTGSLFVGARHVEVTPGTYRIVKLSRYARALFDELSIAAGPGDVLPLRELDAILDWSLRLIESALAGDRAAFRQTVAGLHEQAPFDPTPDLESPVFCLSGGVGELVYDILRTKQVPPTTQFGDLGIDLANRLATSPQWQSRPAGTSLPNAGRATVYGLLLHAMQISGSTIYLPDPALLPARDLPILGRITADSTDEQIRDICNWPATARWAVAWWCRWLAVTASRFANWGNESQSRRESGSFSRRGAAGAVGPGKRRQGARRLRVAMGVCSDQAHRARRDRTARGPIRADRHSPRQCRADLLLRNELIGLSREGVRCAN